MDDDDGFEVCDEAHVTDQELFYCAICRFGFCNSCWDQQITHRTIRRGQPHIKTNFEVARKVKSVLSPSADEAVQERLYGADASTAWFGIDRIDDESLIFRDYGKYAHLLDQTSNEYIANTESLSLDSFIPETRDRRTPSLISFVGQTGAGKSTIIRLLIEFNSKSAWKYGVPIVGAANAEVPSSEDVHLYLDPVTALSPAPMLYADCEGLGGGEREPLGAKFKKARAASSGGLSEQDYVSVRYGSERELSWATSSETRSRGFVVAQLYPRLLYTFSDVIVFVLRNPRVVESVFQTLIEWAAAALEKSSNQPILPHAIIVLNACPHDRDAEKWDIDKTTEQLLNSLKDTAFQNPAMARYVEFWRQRGCRIEKLADLVSAYYFGIQIVRIPTEERPDLIEAQVQEMYARIMYACGSARDRKSKKRMLLDAEELHYYLQYAFEHFASTLDFPFDFVRASLYRNPIPSNFGGNILKMAILLRDVAKPPMPAQAIFKHLSMLVASCIMLDSVRHDIKGTADHLFPEYREHLNAALSNFYEHQLPCDFVGPYGDKCVNVRSGHSKGHQTAGGTVFAVGEHSSVFSLKNDGDDFRDTVFVNLEKLLERLAERIHNGELQEIAAPEIHRDEVLSRFHSDLAWSWSSQSLCLCCLAKPPEYALPCGHIFCTSCIMDYGVRQSRTAIEMYKCPIHGETWRKGFPLSIYTKPTTAGVRVLTLEGGGIRSIIQVEILHMLEETFRGRIPLQCFFDLIIADGSGGIVGLGLATHKWSAERCANALKSIYSHGLVRRTGSNVPGVGWILRNFKSKFETTPFKSALRKAFLDSPLFGGQSSRRSSPYFMRVAVVANSTILKTVLMTNYNRQRHTIEPYHFFRPEMPASELTLCEVARATTALSGYFKPFRHEISNQIFSNDAIPMDIVSVTGQEWRFVWPDLPLEYPDVVLSLGTGYRAEGDTSSSRKGGKATRRRLIKSPAASQKPEHSDVKPMNLQELWDIYTCQLSDLAMPRFWRLDPEFEDSLPEIDDASQLEAYRRRLRSHAGIVNQIPRLTAQLVASMFFFELSEPISESETGGFLAKGSILCRLPPNSPEIRELAMWIKDHQVGGPLFLARQETIQDGGLEHCIDGTSCLNDMLRDQQFTLEAQSIPLSGRNEKTDIYLCLSIKDLYNSSGQYEISGMPRVLFKDPGALARQSQASTSYSRDSISERGLSLSIASDPRVQQNNAILSSQGSLGNLSQVQTETPLGSQPKTVKLPGEPPGRPVELDSGLQAQVNPRMVVSTSRPAISTGSSPSRLDTAIPSQPIANVVSNDPSRRNIYLSGDGAGTKQQPHPRDNLGPSAQQRARSSTADVSSNASATLAAPPTIMSESRSTAFPRTPAAQAVAQRPPPPERPKPSRQLDIRQFLEPRPLGEERDNSKQEIKSLSAVSGDELCGDGEGKDSEAYSAPGHALSGNPGNPSPQPAPPPRAAAVQSEYQQKSQIFRSVLQEFLDNPPLDLNFKSVLSIPAVQKTFNSFLQLYPQTAPMFRALWPAPISQRMKHGPGSHHVPPTIDPYLFCLVMMALSAPFVSFVDIRSSLKAQSERDNPSLAPHILDDFLSLYRASYEQVPEYEAIKNRLLKDLLETHTVKRNFGNPRFAMSLASIMKCGGNPFKMFNLTPPKSAEFRKYLYYHDGSMPLMAEQWVQGILSNVPQEDDESIRTVLSRTLESLEPEEPGEQSCKILLFLLDMRLRFDIVK